MTNIDRINEKLRDYNSNTVFEILFFIIEPILETKDYSNKVYLFMDSYLKLHCVINLCINKLKDEGNQISKLFIHLFRSLKATARSTYRSIKNSNNSENNGEYLENIIPINKFQISYNNVKYYSFIDRNSKKEKKNYLLISTYIETTRDPLFSEEITNIFSILAEDSKYLPIPIFGCTFYTFNRILTSTIFNGLHYAGHSSTNDFIFFDRELSIDGFSNIVNNSVYFNNSYFDLIYLNSCYSNNALNYIRSTSYKYLISYLTINDDKYACDFSKNLYIDFMVSRDFAVSFSSCKKKFISKTYIDDLVFTKNE